MIQTLTRMIPLFFRSLVGVIAIAAAVGIYWALVKTKPQVETSDPDRFVRELAVFEPSPVAVRRPWQGYGTAQARNTAAIPSRVTAVVLDKPIAIEPGMRVVANETVLVDLDPADAAERLKTAEQSLSQLRAQVKQVHAEKERLTERIEIEERNVEISFEEFERLQDLAARSAATPQDVDRREREWLEVRRVLVLSKEALDRIEPRLAELESAIAGQEAAIAVARLDVERSTITSPISGILQSVDVEVGESVVPGQQIARVVDPSVIEVPIKLPAAARRGISVGDEVKLIATDDRALSWNSQIVRIAPEEDAQQQTMTVFAEFEQSETVIHRLRPGMFVEAIVYEGVQSSQWVLPRRTVRRGRIWLVEDGVVHSRAVTVAYELSGTIEATGLLDDSWVVLDDGQQVLGEGMDVVINASSTLSDGQKAKVKPINGSLPNGESEQKAKQGSLIMDAGGT